MRPLKLEVEGFTSFRRRLVLDFANLDLFAITGATGAGKSSLIDAIVFALYGQVPRVGDDYKQLISHNAERLSVWLEFSAGEKRYRVARTVFPRRASTQRLDRLLPDGTTEPLADRAREIRDQIEKILGLDYDAFVRSVVLPQGQFDAFLTGEPKERRKILVALLDLGVYERMAQLANKKGGDRRQEAEFLARQIATDFADATVAVLEAKRLEIADGKREAARIDALTQATRERLAAARRVHTLRAELATVDADLAQEVRRVHAARRTLESAGERRDQLDVQTRALDTQIALLAYDEDRERVLLAARPRAASLLEVAGEIEHASRESERCARALAAARQAVGTASAAVERADAEAHAATAALDATRKTLDQTRRAHAAVALRRGLKLGDVCPVCERPIKNVPSPASVGLDQAEAAAERAAKTAAAAAAAAQKHHLDLEKRRVEVASLEREHDQLDERAAAATARAAAATTALAEAGFPIDTPGAARRLCEAITGELEQQDAVRRTRNELVARRARLEEAMRTLEADVATATGAFEAASARSDELSERRSGVAASLEAAIEALRGLSDDRTGTRPPSPTGSDEVDPIERELADLEAKARTLTARVATAASEAKAIEQKLARVAELRQSHAQLEGEAALLKTLATHLRADELIAWIQEEALVRLARDGSRHLEMLSQGRYALALGPTRSPAAKGAEAAKAEQEFWVVDRWNGDSERSVRTLSGGETFLASLALALGLAESIGELSAEGRASDALESLFLDEGFGSLDGETLDVVVSALDALQGGRSLVGIVTHVRDLAERMPARLEVRRDGDSAVVVVA